MRGYKSGLVPTEAQIELQILDYLVKVRSLFAWKNPSAGYFDAKRNRFRKHTNPYAINGAPDIILVYHGSFVGFEVKRPNGRQSENQKAFERLIRASGGFYFIVHSVEETIEALDSLQMVD